DDLWDEPSPSMNVSSISEAMQPTLKGHLKRACKQISILETPTREVGLKNPYLICDYYRRPHEADECEQNNLSEQEKEEDGPEWTVRTIDKCKTPEASTLAITTRSGISTRDPPFPASPRPTTNSFEEKETKKPESTEKSPTQEPAPQSSILYQPSKTSNPPFPSRLKKQKKDDEDENLLSIFKQIHINLPFLEAMIHMPMGAKVLKDLLSHKEKLEKATSSVKLSEECSAIIQKNLPPKEGDLGSFTLPCLIGSLAVKNALADLGASINLMPHSLFQRLGISKLKPTKIILEMAKDKLVSIILGRPFLATARAVINVHKGKLSLRVGSETFMFNIGKCMKSKHSRDDYLYCADHTAKLVQEQWVDTVNHVGKWIEKEEKEDSNKALAVSFYPRVEPVEPLEWKTSRIQLKLSSVEPLELKLKALPKHLEYAFLQENNKLLVVISLALSTNEKNKLLKVLRNHKGAIAWSITDIKRNRLILLHP
ncbi:DNA-directed DNA polymerase, partial [Tanacetum coccineum]